MESVALAGPEAPIKALDARLQGRFHRKNSGLIRMDEFSP